MTTLEQRRDAIEAVRDRLQELTRHHARMSEMQVAEEGYDIIKEIIRINILDNEEMQRISRNIEAGTRASKAAPQIMINYLECSRWELLGCQMDLYNQIRKLDPSYD